MNKPTLDFILKKVFSRGTRGFLKKEFPEFLLFIEKEYPDNLSTSEKLYWYFHDIKEHPKCKFCGSTSVSYNGLNKGYHDFCSLKCARNHPDTINKLKTTNIERYGVEYNSQASGPKNKMKETNLKKYGHVCSLHNNDIQIKSRKTKLNKYGDETYTNPLKMKETNLKKYGVPCTLQSDLIKSKSRKTKLERYGDETYTNRNKAYITNKEKYGGNTPFHSKNIQNLSRITKLKNFQNDNSSWLKGFDYDEYQRLIYICNCPHPECNKCKSKEYKILAQQYDVRRYNNIETCTHLLPIQIDKIQGTYIELFVRNILDEYNIEYRTNARDIIPPKEIDIYIPSKKIAIECNGIYWHSRKDEKYHYEKYVDCKNQGVQLLTVWEDWIVHKSDILKSIILSKLGIYSKRIYARKCKLKEISSNDARKFLEINHLQGYINSSVRIGLYYDDELVSLMTFGKKRSIMNKNSRDLEFEMYRFCNSLNTQIVGGASKLLNYFIKIYHPKSIESFSSNDISNGKLYNELGFNKKRESISFWYINENIKRNHRFKYQKDVDKTKILKIYDSGVTNYLLERS